MEAMLATSSSQLCHEASIQGSNQLLCPALPACRPFLLHYPRDRIAVIDDVCMLHQHSAQQKKGEVGGRPLLGAVHSS